MGLLLIVVACAIAAVGVVVARRQGSIRRFRKASEQACQPNRWHP